MGDFEDVFGAGADAADIIDGYSDQYVRSSHKEQVNWWGNASPEELAAAEELDENDAWRASMTARKFEQGPCLSTYSELSDWEKTNKRAHIRRRTAMGFEVFFTDEKCGGKMSSPAAGNTRNPTSISDDEIPF